jgi:transposase
MSSSWTTVLFTKVCIRAFIEEKGHKLHFNFPCNPCMNPIEEFFGSWKAKVDEYPEVPTDSGLEQIV